MVRAAKKTESREDRVRRICEGINKGDFGGDNHDAVTWLGSREAIPVERWSSGCPQLDWAMGGGWPKGRFVELFGPEAGGKTTIALHAIAEHQKRWPGEDVALIDSEFAFDEVYAQAIGVNTKYLIVNQPESGAQALNVLEKLIEDGIGLAIVDSVAALTTEDELSGDIGAALMGTQARLLSPALRRLTAVAGSRRATIFWTNQIREKIGVMFGSPQTTPGGRALKHYASIRVHLSRIANIKESDGSTILSTRNRADIRKNKVAPPFKRAEFCLTFGIGVDITTAVLDDAIEMKVIAKRGSWLNYEGDQLGQGRAQSLAHLRENPELVEELRTKVEAKRGITALPKAPDSQDESPDPDAIDTPQQVDETEVEVTDV